MKNNIRLYLSANTYYYSLIETKEEVPSIMGVQEILNDPNVRFVQAYDKKVKEVQLINVDKIVRVFQEQQPDTQSVGLVNLQDLSHGLTNNLAHGLTR